VRDNTESPRVFVLLHGWENFRGQGHWQRWLAEELLTRGELVVYPQLPDADHPDLETWLQSLSEILERLKGLRITVVAHSLACALWLRYVERCGWTSAAEHVVLVSVPSPDVLAATEVRPFVEGSRRISRPVDRRLTIVFSDNDPYCPEGALTAYSIDEDVDTRVVPGAGHIIGATGYGPWPDLLRVLDVRNAN
jgi:predicted alpha/beta hydrolase family esterase